MKSNFIVDSIILAVVCYTAYTSSSCSLCFWLGALSSIVAVKLILTLRVLIFLKARSSFHEYLMSQEKEDEKLKGKDSND